MLIRVIRDILIQSLTYDQTHECFRPVVADAVRDRVARKTDEVAWGDEILITLHGEHDLTRQHVHGFFFIMMQMVLGALLTSSIWMRCMPSAGGLRHRPKTC